MPISTSTGTQADLETILSAIDPGSTLPAGVGPGSSGGGRVIGAGSEAAARVRLHLPGGVFVEDSVDGGIVLFMVDRPIEVPRYRRDRRSGGIPAIEPPSALA
jgi:hypothetical protein